MAYLDWQNILSGFLDLVLLAGVLFYITLVVLSYFNGRGYIRPRLDFHDPARSIERWAVWVGVKALVLVLRAVNPIYEMLSEASAEVGEWFLNRRHHETH